MKIVIRYFWIAVIATASSSSSNLAEENRDAAKESSSVDPIRLLGSITIAGTQRDKSGLNQELVPVEGTSSDEIPEGRKFFSNMFGGISAIAWTGEGDLYWLLPDRGPLDGAVDWACRVQKVRIRFDHSHRKNGEVEIVDTVLLKDSRGISFTGLASAYAETPEQTQRLDPEGIRVGANGNLFISDEYGPRLIEFTTSGQFVREFDMPNKYLIENPGLSKPTENPTNKMGRQTNRGMEGLAVSADGKCLIGLMQSPLLQDCHRASLGEKPTGFNCRIPVFNSSGDFVKEHVYCLDSDSYKLNEILACGKDTYVAIERDGEAGTEAKFKRIVLFSTTDASNTIGNVQLPSQSLLGNVRPVAKSNLIDLLAAKWGLSGVAMPEKIEGLAFGPDVDEHRRLLLVASDNDFVPEHGTQIYAFAINKKALRMSLPTVSSSE